MTAEIAVMNKVAVALASDSAVSFQGGSGYKVYNTTEKLFRLSSVAPVGVMIYGAAEFMGVPWQVLVKLFRKELGTTELPHLKDYASRFLKFLADKSTMFPKAERERYVQRISIQLFRTVARQLDGLATQAAAGSRKSVNIAAEAKEEIEKFASRLTKFKELQNLPPDFQQQVKQAFSAIVQKIGAAELKRHKLDQQTMEALVSAVLGVFAREHFMNVSGIVISGYGDEEIFPALVSYEIEGIALDGFVKYRITHDMAVGFDNNAGIVPFAQKEMVETFMEGVHPNVAQYLRRYLVEVFESYNGLVLKSLPKISKSNETKLSAKLKEGAKQIVQKCWDDIKDHQLQRHISPVLSALGALPKEELASMAETLVNLTSFKRKISTDAETVGGPVDVLVISKTDGLVWVKRKKYFSGELNPNHNE